MKEHMQEETITIAKSEYDSLMKSVIWLDALEAAGVDNWCGYEEAQSINREMKAEYALQTK